MFGAPKLSNRERRNSVYSVVCCATRRSLSLFTERTDRVWAGIPSFVRRQSHSAPNLPINEWNHLVERLNYLLRSIICFQGCWFVWLYYNEHTKLSFHLFDMCLVIAEKRLLCCTLSDVILVVYLILLHFRLVFINGVCVLLHFVRRTPLPYKTNRI